MDRLPIQSLPLISVPVLPEVHHGVCPGAWLRKGGWEEMVGSKAFDFYALSWDILRKPA